MNRLMLLAAASPMVLAAIAPSVSAQEADADKDTGVIEEIIVSAQRRDQSNIDVPVAVSSFTGDDLIALGAQDITYLNQVVPNVTIERSRATNTTITAFIRGVGQQDPVAGYEQGVGVYIDDVYLNRPQGAILEVFDVERVEVLRGPQGTLYGRNTIGGAIKYVTKRLGDEFSGSLRVNGGTYGQMDAVASVTAPISDTLRFGAAFGTFNRNGFGESLTTGEDNYDKEIIAARGVLEFTPNDQLFVRVSSDYTRDTSNPRHGHRLVQGQFSGARILGNVFNTRSAMTPPPEPLVENFGVSNLIEYQVNDNWTVKNILAYRDNKSGQLIDFDSLAVVDLEAPFALEDDQFTEEFQVLYNSDAINFVAGFFYMNASAFNEFDVRLDQTGALLSLPRLNAFTLGNVETDTWSLYGDASFDLTQLWGWGEGSVEAVELTLGGRFTSDERRSQVLRQTWLGPSTSFGDDGVLLATTSDFNGEARFEDFNPRVVLTVKPDSDTTLYASFSQGFKGGGFDPRALSTAAPDLNGDGNRSEDEIFSFFDFLPETITTYEAGWKGRLADGRVLMNVAAFYSDYQDVQIPGSIGVDSDGDGVAEGFSGLVTNAGAAEIYGIEFDGQALLSNDLTGSGDSLNFFWTAGWIEAEFTEFIAAVTDPATGGTSLQDISNQRFVQNTPRWTGSASFVYAAPMQLIGDGEISFRPALSFRSLTRQFEFESPIDQPFYALVDASLVWTSDDSKYQIGLHGRNLTDQRYIVAGYDFLNIASPLGLEGNLTAFYGDPATFTASFQINF